MNQVTGLGGEWEPRTEPHTLVAQEEEEKDSLAGRILQLLQHHQVMM
jgi:hypothetical protein